MATRRCIASAVEEDDSEQCQLPDVTSDGVPLVVVPRNPVLLSLTRTRMLVSAALDALAIGCSIAASCIAWLNVSYFNPAGSFTWQFFVVSDVSRAIVSCDSSGVCVSVGLSDLREGEWEDTGALATVSTSAYALTIACEVLTVAGLLAGLFSALRLTRELRTHTHTHTHTQACTDSHTQDERYWMRRGLYPPIRHAAVLLVSAAAIASYALITSMFVRDNQLELQSKVDLYIGFWCMVATGCLQGAALLTWLLPSHGGVAAAAAASVNS